MLLIIAHLFHFELYHYTVISHVTTDIESQKEHYIQKNLHLCAKTRTVKIQFLEEESIMKWTTEKRYKRYEDWSEAERDQLKSTMEKSPWRAKYHVEPSSGLLNDPNGFSYFDGKWILFYQNFPFGAAHGLKSWVQLESDNLVTFKETGVKVLPDTPLDSHGAYSGSALQFGDQLFLFLYRKCER